MRFALRLVIMLGTVWGASPGFGHYPDLSQPLLQGLFSAAAVPLAAAQTEDSLASVDVNHPDYKYPGRAMLLSLMVPGAGQLYVHQPLKSVAFLGAEVLAVLAFKGYNQRGLDQTQAFRDTADVQWNFRDWIFKAPNFQGGKWEPIKIGLDGSHHLDFFVGDMDGDGRPEVFGNTLDDGVRLSRLLNDSDTSSYVSIKKNGEYYENIGKYNQFFSGWDDAGPDALIEDTKSGLIARSDHRDAYLSMRAEANRLKSTANYVISAIMFNHVLSAVDAIFATARWNRQHALRLGGGLWFDPSQSRGVGGVQVSLAW